jgi:hypothetical protein
VSMTATASGTIIDGRSNKLARFTDPPGGGSCRSHVSPP